MRLILLLFVFVLSSIGLVSADPMTVEGKEITLNECRDEKFKIKFLCHPDWPMKTDKDVIYFDIAPEDKVSLTISKSRSGIVSLDQLSSNVLQGLGDYEDGFSTTSLKISDVDAIGVEATSKDHPELSVIDFYVIRNNDFYAFLFAVSKDKIKDYEALITEIINSFEFL